MEEIKGIDTIRGLVGEPPRVIDVPYKIVELENKLMPAWNNCHIAILPYCFKCREPLVWIYPPKVGEVMFKCEKCKREWRLADGV